MRCTAYVKTWNHESVVLAGDDANGEAGQQTGEHLGDFEDESPDGSDRLKHKRVEELRACAYKEKEERASYEHAPEGGGAGL